MIFAAISSPFLPIRMSAGGSVIELPGEQVTGQVPVVPDDGGRMGGNDELEIVMGPDADDPPDLEFYSGNGFWYHDRAYMLVLNYAASPLALRKHGPHLDNEWWTSRDGLRWERPARGVNALEVFPQIPRLETHPLIVNGMILFLRGHLLLGLPEDRISYVSARANGEFSTKPFPMPAADLLLNAASPAPEDSAEAPPSDASRPGGRPARPRPPGPTRSACCTPHPAARRRQGRPAPVARR